MENWEKIVLLELELVNYTLIFVTEIYSYLPIYKYRYV